jgi:hypothetical protein|tara:strand:- start:23 stop:268 length:246 start_codon:yes stop_codon:yes gene_type:complete
MDKIDTQGLSGPVTKGCTDNVYPHDENGDPILPKGEWKELPIFTDKERKELKEIMLEALKEFHNKPDLPDYRPFRLDELQE